MTLIKDIQGNVIYVIYAILYYWSFPKPFENVFPFPKDMEKISGMKWINSNKILLQQYLHDLNPCFLKRYLLQIAHWF